MAYFYRLIIAAVLVFVSNVASASVYMYVYSGTSPQYSTVEGVCNGYLDTVRISGWTYAIVSMPPLSGSSGTCNFSKTRTSDGAYYTFSYSYTRVTLASCPAGYVASGTSCIVPPPDPAIAECQGMAVLENSTLGGGPQDKEIVGRPPDGPVCVPNSGTSGAGCTASFETFIRFEKAGVWVSQGRATRDAASTVPCTVGATESTPIPDAPAPACPAGQQMGQVNSVNRCMPFGPSVKTETKKKNVDESVDSTGAPVTTTKDATTLCVNSTCTTTTTTTVTNSSGSSSSTASASKAKSDFCKENPKSKECGTVGDGASSFGGSCAASFKCEGDALMCAMASEQHTRNCELFVNPSSESALYDAAKALDSSKSVIIPTAVNISSSMFNSSNILGAGSGCIADKNVTISGHSMTLPFSSICQYLEYIGFLNLAIAFVLAGRIVARG